MLGPRKNYLSWDDTFMLEALIIAQRSKDPNTQVGAVVVNPLNKLIGAGYNGPARGICTNRIPWDREGEPEDTKYPYIIHAEDNAVKNAVSSTEDGKIYTTLYPCNRCANDIIQAGIKEVIYLENTYKDAWFTKVADRLFSNVDIITRQHHWDSKENVKKHLENILRSL